jgi:hypothetical protein
MRILIEQLRPDFRQFAPHPDDFGALVSRIDLERQSRWLWNLSVPYSSEVTADELEFKQKPLSGGDPATGDRTQLGVRLSVTTSHKQKLLSTDIEGNPFKNTAGDPIIGIEAERSFIEVRISADVDAVKPAVWEYRDAINNAAVKFNTPQLKKTFPKNTLRVVSISASELEFSGLNEYTTLEMVLQENPDGWNHKELNLGLREAFYSSNDGKNILRPILDGTGVPITEPVFLDQYGHAYRVGVNANNAELEYVDVAGKELRTDLTDDEIIVLDFKVYHEKPFGVLNLN